MSTLRIEFPSLRNMLIRQGYQVVIYQLPEVGESEGKARKGAYARLQNRLKASVGCTYYYQQWGRRLYCLLPSGTTVQTLTWDQTELLPQVLTPQQISDLHQEPFVNLMLAEYLQSEGKYVSNERFFIYVNPIQGGKYAVAMSLQVRRNRSAFSTGRDKYHFAIVGRVMRFRKVTAEDYEGKWRRKRVPYALDLSEVQTPRLRQLRPDEAQAHGDELYVLKSNRKNKASVPFLSLDGREGFLRSRVGLMGQFIHEFVAFLTTRGLDARQEQLRYRKVGIPQNRLLRLMHGFRFQVLDCRERRAEPLHRIISRCRVEGLRDVAVHEDEATLVPGLPVLLWMDAASSYYDVDGEGSSLDPYKRFKAKYPGIASQGFNHNRNKHDGQASEGYLDYEPKWTTDQERNLNISLRQLLLKEMILHPEAVPTQGLLPASMNRKVFLSYFSSNETDQIGRFIIFAMEGGLPKVREFTDCIELRGYIGQITGNKGFGGLWEKLCPPDSGLSTSQIEAGLALEPYLKMWRRLKAVVFDERGVLKIELPGEYALYDYRKVLERFAIRGKVHPTGDLLPKGDTDLHRKVEDFFEEYVHERQMSYEQLKARYGKGERGLFQLFSGKKDERAYLALLRKSGGPMIPGLKEQPLYDIHQGIWYEENERKYFVGKKGAMNKYSQPYGFPIRWLDVSGGFRFEEAEFFEWFDQEFIREKEMTVLPLPFTLIRMKNEMTS